jgi:S-DNA-T family DNA segregation ATPase FtsK/SpoIIIE
MQELIDQPAPSDAPANGAAQGAQPAPAAGQVDRREQQRAALRDLVELSTACAATEAEVDERLKKSLAEADDAYKKCVREIEERYTLLREESAAAYQQRQTEARAAADAEAGSIHKRDRAARQRVRNEMEPTEREIKSKFDQAVWMAESVFEVADQTVGAEAKKSKEAYEEKQAALNSAEAQGWRLLGTYRIAMPEDGEAYALPLSDDPHADYEAQLALAHEHLHKLNRVKCPSMFIGANLYISAVVFGGIAAGVAQVMVSGADRLNVPVMAAAFAVVAAAVVGVVTMLKAAARAHVEPLRQALSTANKAARQELHDATRAQEAARQQAMDARRAEVLGARERFKPMLTEAARARDAAVVAIQADFDARTAAAAKAREAAAREIEAWREQTAADLARRHRADLDAAEQQHGRQRADAEQAFREARTALEARLNDGLAHIRSPITTEGAGVADTILAWDDPRWKDWMPPKAFPPSVRIGELEVDLRRLADGAARGNKVRLALPAPFKVPVTLGFPRQASLLVQSDREGRPTAIKVLQTAMARLLTQLPAGRARFTILDPVGLGQNFAGVMHLADHDDQLVGGRIWTEAEQIEQKLTNLTEHMETVIQKYLRNEFETIDDYNAQAGELAEPYRFLVIADFPVSFQGNAYRRLASIAATGARCGVYTLISRDTRHPLPGGTHLEELEANSVNIVQRGDTFVWKDKVFAQFPLTLDPAPQEDMLTGVLDKVGKAAKLANRVEVSFDTIAPKRPEYWTRDTVEDLVVPIGRMGATRLQYLRFGKGVAQHALLAGKTGSGKSTLLHAIVTNMAMWYDPDEVEIYLIDFKKGVEFKTYATHHLPHARAIAVESDREFGLSVLQRLDAELSRRGEIFRREGVQDSGAYRRGGGTLRMPRILLIIDEFQEFFSEDDKLAQEAGLLLDRLVRQGRAFGIHLLLGSQTIGGTSGLARSTIGQMAVRIALQTSEADSHLILGDNNSAARLLSRPGEAIYNDAGGLVEGNSPFQVAWLPDEKREVYLEAVQRMASDKYGPAAAPGDVVVFEGNAAADIRTNLRLARVIEGKQRPSTPAPAPVAWLGDPVAIKEPTGITFRRQAGANVLMVGQQEEQAMAITVGSIVALAAQNPPGGARFYILDGTPADSTLATVFPSVKASLPGYDMRMVEYRLVGDAMNEIDEERKARQSGGGGAESIFVVIYGLQRYRVLRKSEDSFGGGFSMSMSDDPDAPPKATPADKAFADILKEGPGLGIHVIAWADTAVSLDRTLDRNAMREFDNRILFQMSANDSSNLIDSPAANKLGFHRALAYSEEQGVMEKFRPYALPDKGWLDEVKEKLAR